MKVKYSQKGADVSQSVISKATAVKVKAQTPISEDFITGLSGSSPKLFPTPDLSGPNVSHFCWLPTRLAARWLPHESGESERIRPHLTPLECGIIVGGIPEGAIFRKVGLIWGIPVQVSCSSSFPEQRRPLLFSVFQRAFFSSKSS
jgi:hypothetical protein